MSALGSSADARKERHLESHLTFRFVRRWNAVIAMLGLAAWTVITSTILAVWGMYTYFRRASWRRDAHS